MKMIAGLSGFERCLSTALKQRFSFPSLNQEKWFPFCWYVVSQDLLQLIPSFARFSQNFILSLDFV